MAIRITKINSVLLRMDALEAVVCVRPKKITLPQKWIADTVKTSRASKKLHLMYQTN